MTGSILQLAATGIDTIYLTGNPTITHFKIVYRRHTNFTLYPIVEKLQDFTKFDSVGRFKLPKKGDCISQVYLQFEIGDFNVLYEDPTKKNIDNLLKQFGISTWVNNYNDNFIITPQLYTTSIKPYVYDAIESYVTLNNYYLRFIDDITRGINFYHQNNDALINTILKKMNRIYTSSSFFTDRNYVYQLLDTLKRFLKQQNYVDNFQYVNNNIITDVSGQDVCGNIVSITNAAFIDTSDNIIYQGDYIDWLFNFGYGLYSLNSNGDYIRDNSGNRVEKAYQLDNSGNYIYDNSGNKIYNPSNLTQDTQLLSRMFDILLCYKRDLDLSGFDMNNVNFKTSEFIRDTMYDSYLNKILPIPSIDISSTPLGISVDTVTNFFNTNALYNSKFIYTLYVLLNETSINTPSVLNFLDKKILDYYDSYLNDIYGNENFVNLYYHYNDISGTYYKKFDTFKIINKFLNTLNDSNIYNEASITNVRPYLIKSINDNLITNYLMYDIIVSIILSNFQFTNNPIIYDNNYLFNYTKNTHIRFGVYTTYTKIINEYFNDQNIPANISPTSYNLSDGFIDYINNDIDLNASIYSECFFKTDITQYYNDSFLTLNNNLPNNIFNPYFNDKTLWDFLVINQDPLKTLLTDISFNNIPVYNTIITDLSNNTINKLAIMNLIPFYLMYEIPLAVNNVLSIIIPSALVKTTLDLSGNNYIDGSFNKMSIYKTILTNTLIGFDNTYNRYSVIDYDFINNYADINVADNNKFSLFRLIRPEKKYQFDVSGKSYFIPNTRAVIELYRKQYVKLMSDISGSITPATYRGTLLYIFMLLNEYCAFDNPEIFDTNIPYTGIIQQSITPADYITYDFYKSNAYRYYQFEYLLNNTVNNNIVIDNFLPANNITKYKYAQTSIYNYIEKYNFNFLNKIFNEQLINLNYYNETLGLGMYNLYEFIVNKIKSYDISGSCPNYFTGNNLIEFNTNTQIYPEINFIYDISFNPVYSNYENYSIYNNTGTNKNIPVDNGFDYNDFQMLLTDLSNNIIDSIDISMNDPYNPFRLTSINLLLNTYNLYYTNEKPLLNIMKKILDLNQFTTYKIQEIIDNYNNLIDISNVNYNFIQNVNNIIFNTKNDLSNNYIAIGDMIYDNSYDLSFNNKLNWSFKNLYDQFIEVSNPFDISKNPLLYECYDLHNSFGTQIVNKYNTITDNVVNMKIFNNPLKYTKLYDNFNNKYDLFTFLKKYLISNTSGLSDANYLLRFYDPTITDYENNILDYLKNNKKIYYNIILKILYPKKDVSGFLPENPIDYTNQRFVPYFQIQNIFSEYNTFEGSVLDIILNSMVNNLTANYCWVKELGHFMCEYVNLEINKDVIDSYNPFLFSLGRKLLGEATKLRGYDYLIGNRKELYTYNNKNKSNIKITIPLQFWFCKNIFNSLPMTNILYSDVEITFRLKKLLDLLVIAPYSFIDKTPRIRCKFLINNVYLENEERLRIAASKLEFLVETHQTTGLVTFKYENIENKKIRTRLYFSGPAKFILWRAKIRVKDNINFKDNYKFNWNENGLVQLSRYTKTVYAQPYNLSVNLVYTNETIIKIIYWTKILFNGNVRQENSSDYFNYVTPYSANLNYLDPSEFIYSFALFPKLSQPSGAANLSMIEDITIEHELTDDIINIMKDNNFVLEMEYFTETYQIMRVMSGFIAPAFIYPK
jgi:hypothetical protein